ncbi:hypothetical protein CAPTEDRAFT_188864 [Capitella teleta]|uniref:CCDC66 domain-containing protein n=1 Tax=Capitella teleta TaxID=283909 RepID=R7TCF8_CAPTE|nr:hypothetical protein CAPTEDRAFT_188864 [Capitella teleta]|eukprot:ELT88746.1 hypothetical protein CAPTEDRAFT_188864 [Capitella teleta]
MQKLGITPSPRQPKTPVANPSTSAFEYSKDDPLLPHQRAALQAREPQPPPAVASQRQPPPSTQWQKSEEPAAIRSSFVVGNGTPDDDRFVSAKERKRLLWLQELEKQREEDRQRKAKEKSYGRQDEETHWADKFSNYQPKGLPAQDSIAPPPPNDTAARISSAPVQTMDTTSNKLEDATYLRGQNTRIDPVTLRELEDKRKKEQQHQDFIRQQIEEKARLKREERERRVREELEEEKQLQKERTHGLTHREDAKQKEKDEAERKRALEEAIERAQEAAEMDKHQKRLLKLQQGGHDVSNFETKTPRNMLPAQFNTGTIVEPSHVPGLDSSPRDVETQNQGYYTENRVLTPTDQRTARKEFGVQTESDITLGNREETDIEYQGPFSKKVRIKSGPKDGRPKKPVKINERPKWGYQNAAKKKAVKQSARDPHYEQKKQRAEIMKQERQQAMLKMQQEQRRTVTRETAASRSRSHEPKSPMIPKHQDYDQYARQNLKDTSHKSQTPPPSVPTKHRSPSPPVPTIKHMIRECDDQYKQTSSRVGGSKYADMDPTYNNSDFIPFVRTTDLLDPSKADESVPVSREQSAVQRGRKVYQQELNPAKYGKKMANIKDKNESYTKDPILQPNLVTEHPTSRQGQILQQLSSLRRGLMLKQRELEMNDGALGLA